MESFPDVESAGEAVGRRCMGDGRRTARWIIGDAGCESIAMQSTGLKIPRTALVFSCRVVKIEGVLRRMLMPSEAATLSSGGIAAEKTNDVPLIRYG